MGTHNRRTEREPSPQREALVTAAPVIHWFRCDLRLADNPALTAASDVGRPVIPVYVHDTTGIASRPTGGAGRWWLHHSLASLDASLRAADSRLVLRQGSPIEILIALAREVKACAIHMTRGYEPLNIKVEAELKAACADAGIELRRFSSGLLFEPEAVRTKMGEPYKVFTPFWKACLEQFPPARTLPAPAKLAAPAAWPASLPLESLEMLPIKPDWAGGLRRAAWTPGEAGAAQRLLSFLDDAAAGYSEMRDRPDRAGTSRLSPHLHFGEISPRQCWHAADFARLTKPGIAQGATSFLREIGWREFSAHLLFHWPSLPEQAFRPDFAAFPWKPDSPERTQQLRAWQLGRTGYPIVDAGMRQLWETGWMHNRVRMIVASFLCKHLLIHWREGESWFWDTLVDADLASNAASWQWVAGSGADAAPYFRIFNPILQGVKFDPDGAYVHRFVPELALLPAPHVHAPWDAPRAILSAAGVTLGQTYPHPIVEHALAREKALAAYAAMKTDSLAAQAAN